MEAKTILTRKETEEDDMPPLEDRVFDAEVLVEFSCAVCLHLIQEPRQCTYGHNICLRCFQELVKYPHLRSECPTCRCPMDRNSPNRNLILENLLSKLDIYCRYHFIQTSTATYAVDPEGCSEHMNRLEMANHEKNCPRAIVNCPHSHSCGPLRRGDIEAHLRRCDFKPVDCAYCGDNMLRREMEAHYTECPELPLTCSHCSQSILQKRMRRHLDRECDGKMHECPYSLQGCDVGELSASDLRAHLTQCSGEHLELVQSGFASSLKLMENKFHKMLAIKDAEIEELKRASRNRYRFSWEIEWKVDGSIRAFTSERFDIFGHKFYIALWPIGEPQEDGTPPKFSELSRQNSSDLSGYNGGSGGVLATTAIAQNVPSTSPSPGTSPSSLTGGFFDRLMQFRRNRASSLESIGSPPVSSTTTNNTSTTSSTTSSSITLGPAPGSVSSPTPGTQQAPIQPSNGPWVALYLMMETEQPAPPMSSAAPRIYSPVSGLSSAAQSLQQAPQPLQQHHSAPHQLQSMRSMNVNLLPNRTAPAASSSSVPGAIRPPESMILEYTLRLVNISPLLSKSSYFETSFPLSNGAGWGEEKFIETSQISRSSGFLNRNNVLHVQCDIQVRQCTFDV